MSTSTTAPGYQLAAPSREALIASLARQLGDAEARAIWQRGCAAVGARPTDGSLEALAKVAEYLSKEKGLVGVIASSVRVRLISHRMLANKLTGTAGGR